MSAVEWRAEAGGQVDAEFHGVGEVGVRAGAWSAEWLSDTLELRYAPEGPDGRAWMALRGEAFVAGVMTSPWTDGAPDPSRALTASYVGAEGGWIRYLGAAYAGPVVSARTYVFGATDATDVPVPGQRIVGEAALRGGYWSPGLEGWAQGGARVNEGRVSPWVSGVGVWRPEWTWAPRVEARAGWTEGADDVVATRLGGLNPFVVPVAGAAWGEWWVEDYAAARLGGEVHLRGAWRVDAGPFVDVAWFDGEHAEGLGLGARVARGRWFGEATGGYAPWVTREEGVARASVWVRTGVGWGRRAH